MRVSHVHPSYWLYLTPSVEWYGTKAKALPRSSVCQKAGPVLINQTLYECMVDTCSSGGGNMSSYDPDRHHRRSVRLKEYDYSQPGTYFVTICTHERACSLGEVCDGTMHLSRYGESVDTCWREIPLHFPTVMLDVYVVMPNHIHGILMINVAPMQDMACHVPTAFGAPQRGSLGTIVAAFKSAATKQINLVRNTPGAPLWQTNYYEHIIRTAHPAAAERELRAIRDYILNNPIQWQVDKDNPTNW